jgi:hypothetical protein
MATPLPSVVLQAPEVTLDPGAFPAEVELVPAALWAQVHLHRIETQSGPLFCWSYVTKGLTAFGQAEIVLTVAIVPGAHPGCFPTDPLRFAVTLHDLAAQGRTVEVGGLTELGGAGFMGRNGIVYARAQPMEGVPLPAGALAMIPITAEELAVLKVGGHTRVLSALGKAYRHYPFPPWLDRRRGSVIGPQRTTGTILEQVPHLPVPGSARMESGNVLLRLRPAATPLLARTLAGLPPNAGFALTLEVDPAADGCLTWEAGQTAPAAITPPGSRGERLSGCFVLLVPEQPADGAQLHEDGFGVFLTNASAAALRRALSAGAPLALPARGGSMGIVLEQVQMSYQNPIDGSVIHAAGGFHQYAPAGGPKPPVTAGVELKQIILLTAEHELAARIATSALGAYCKAVEALAGECFAPRGGATWEVLVDLAIAPGGAVNCRLASRGEGVSEPALAMFQQRLGSVGAPPVQGGPVAFQLHFAIGALTARAP